MVKAKVVKAPKAAKKAEAPKVENFANISKEDVVEQREASEQEARPVKWIANEPCYIGGRLYQTGDVVMMPEGEILHCGHKS